MSVAFAIEHAIAPEHQTTRSDSLKQRQHRMLTSDPPFRAFNLLLSDQVRYETSPRMSVA